jgi:hypothetical protein
MSAVNRLMKKWDVMTHAGIVAQGRKEHVKPVVCPGEIESLLTRPQWAKGSADHRFQCRDCGAVLGLVGHCVAWSMTAADWKGLK